MDVHKKGLLHRAFSVYVFNDKGEMLLQQRALGKYHSGGLWTNTCCGHPYVGETTEAGARRRLEEEFGFDCGLTEIPWLIYQVDFGNGLHEHEFLHIYVGRKNAQPNPDPAEIGDWKWIAVPDLMLDLQVRPENYTYWFKLIVQDPEKLKQLMEAK